MSPIVGVMVKDAIGGVFVAEVELGVGITLGIGVGGVGVGNIGGDNWEDTLEKPLLELHPKNNRTIPNPINNTNIKLFKPFVITT